MSQKICWQPEPKENPECSLVKEGKCYNTETKEIVFRPITFSQQTLEHDQSELNKTLNSGFEIIQHVQTSTGIVYVLSKRAVALQPNVPDAEFGQNQTAEITAHIRSRAK